MKKADGFAAVVTRAISKSPVACTPLGGLHDCESADCVVRFVVTVVLGATFSLSALIKTLRRLPTIPGTIYNYGLDAFPILKEDSSLRHQNQPPEGTRPLR